MGIFNNIKSNFREKVKNIVRTTGYTMPYIPYDKGSNEYIITKSEISYPKCEQGLPIPPNELRSGYGSNDDNYLKSGRDDIQVMLNILKPSSFEINGGKKILDFGCSSGRMIRYLKQYSGENEIWGTDISADHIYWNNKYLNPPFQFAVNTTFAHLPFEDKYFDLIYAGSVFTHIDSLNETWLLELRRILSDKGFLYITIHDNETIKILDKNTKGGLSYYLHNHPLYSGARKDFDMFVFNRAKSPQVFFDIGYFEKILKPMFEILSVSPGSYGGHQTALVLKRKSK